MRLDLKGFVERARQRVEDERQAREKHDEELRATASEIAADCTTYFFGNDLVEVTSGGHEVRLQRTSSPLQLRILVKDANLFDFSEAKRDDTGRFKTQSRSDVDDEELMAAIVRFGRRVNGEDI